MDFGLVGAGHAVGRPGAALRCERAMVCGMMVADEEYRHAGILLDKSLGGLYSLFGMNTGEGSSGEETVNLVDYNYCFFHIQSL